MSRVLDRHTPRDGSGAWWYLTGPLGAPCPVAVGDAVRMPGALPDRLHVARVAGADLVTGTIDADELAEGGFAMWRIHAEAAHG